MTERELALTLSRVETRLGDIGIKRLRLLLEIALAGCDGVEVGSLGRRVGLSPSGISKALKALGLRGSGLVAWGRESGNQFRAETVRLTPRGEKLVEGFFGGDGGKDEVG